MPAALKKAMKVPGVISETTEASKANQVISARAADTNICTKGDAIEFVASNFKFCFLLLSLARLNLFISYSSPPKDLTSSYPLIVSDATCVTSPMAV